MGNNDGDAVWIGCRLELGLVASFCEQSTRFLGFGKQRTAVSFLLTYMNRILSTLILDLCPRSLCALL